MSWEASEATSSHRLLSWLPRNQAQALGAFSPDLGGNLSFPRTATRWPYSPTGVGGGGGAAEGGKTLASSKKVTMKGGPAGIYRWEGRIRKEVKTTWLLFY